MFKRLFTLTLTVASLFSHMSYGISYDNITYDWLLTNEGQTYAATGYLPHMRTLFNLMHVKGFLECGCSYTTKFFLERSEAVTSVEFISPGLNVFKYATKLYQNQPNWKHIFYYGSESFSNACNYQCANHKNYALIDPSYLEEMNTFFKEQIQIAHENQLDIDVAFVNPPIYIRGDMINILLKNQIPVVIAHDTEGDGKTDLNSKLYGWDKIETPGNYEKIVIPFEHGTTFWIRKDLPKVIKAMKKYRKNTVKSKILKKDDKTRYKQLTKIADKMA